MNFDHLQIEKDKKGMYNPNRDDVPTDALLEAVTDEFPVELSRNPTIIGSKSCTQMYQGSVRLKYTWTRSCWVRKLLDVSKPNQLLKVKWELFVADQTSEGGPMLTIELIPPPGTLTGGKVYVVQLGARFGNKNLTRGDVVQEHLGDGYKAKIVKQIPYPEAPDTDMVISVRFEKFK